MLLPVPAGAEGSESLWEYAELEDGTVMITAYHGTESAVAVPEELDGRKVTKIGSWAFNECESLESISIPDGVRKIGAAVFSPMLDMEDDTSLAIHPCLSLKTVVLPDSMTEIGDLAFMGCIFLESVTIPESVVMFGMDIFSKCPVVKVTVRPDSPAQKYCDKNGTPYILAEE